MSTNLHHNVDNDFVLEESDMEEDGPNLYFKHYNPLESEASESDNDFGLLESDDDGSVNY